MKKLNKMLSMLLAVIMVLGMNITVMAAGDCSVTIKNSQTGHTYEAYQIFSGTKSGDSLVSIDWGTGVDSAKVTANASLGSDAQAVADALDGDTVEDFAKTVATCLSTTASGTVSGVTNSDVAITGLEPGYYLIKDKANSIDSSLDTAYTSYVLWVVDATTEISLKTSVPKLEKKVADDVTDVATLTDSSDKWEDSADYSSNETIPFKLTATLADNVDTYSKYTLTFEDNLSAGLTYQDDATVKVVANGTEYALGESDLTINSDSTPITITVNDLKQVSALNGVSLNSAEVIVRYTAKFNDNTVIGYEGNPNTAKLVYSNNPNYKADGTGTTDDENNDSTGTTPEDKVIVFTYELDVTKLDGEAAEDATDRTLNGAKFSLYTKDAYTNKGNAIATIDGEQTALFQFKYLGDGDYVLVEDSAPSGYNPIEPIYFTISATHDDVSDNPELTALSVTQVSDPFSSNDFTITLRKDSGKTTLPDGYVSIGIENNTGSQLPTTGGMGTRVIYVLGGAMVFVAAVLLITKRRMSGSENR
jgi:fimbrial isopeptide formation D2 family protein/LPXTG-motif cell wall-anchored protein